MLPLKSVKLIFLIFIKKHTKAQFGAFIKHFKARETSHVITTAVVHFDYQSVAPWTGFQVTC